MSNTFHNIKVSTHVTDEVDLRNIILPKLSHGSRIVIIETGREDVMNCDALITSNKDISLGIKTADCAPICFGDGKKVGIAHVGWRGLCLGLSEKMLEHFDQSTLEVYVGPHLHTFEIQKDFCYDAIVSTFGERFITHQDEKMIFHFRDAIASCLPKDTQFDERNTGEDNTLPSHRRNKTSERILTIVQCNNQHETT